MKITKIRGVMLIITLNVLSQIIYKVHKDKKCGVGKKTKHRN